MKRRSFFNTVAVGLGTLFVNPKLVLAKPKPTTPVLSQYVTEMYSSLERELDHLSGARTPVLLSWLRETYCHLSFGNQHPTLIRVSPYRFDEIWSSMTPPSRYLSERRLPDPSIRFCGADVMASGEVDDHHINFINEKMPHHPKLNRYAVIGERIWFDAKGKEHREMMNA